MKYAKNYWLLLQTILATMALPSIAFHLRGIKLSDQFSPIINQQLSYQLVTLLLAAAMLVVLNYSRKEVFKTYFRKGDANKRFLPAPYLGIRPKPNETWKKAGIEWALVISLVTVIVIYLQLFGEESNPSLAKLAAVFPLAVLAALVNSFVEESICRIGVIVALKGVYDDGKIAIVSGLLFGSVHYFGTPGGFTGAIVSGFLGWFLAKSILETKGIFWAWLIHFLQDIIIITALFAIG
ncbi:CPBP family intramembrane metalloprotease [Cyclobacterium sp. 1_MG-2023]|uniref:CPBP family intramembrane glutamic endopeptidase n=1 Tax=Cyclobacterium sp. 1_MG-2023 TaxID=3062681 RepID=UPI0026E2B11D|nr:CPBP family intramembrane glutamic endopeptidase [Cyclobacterium sp. 1_MG-2023]MDO6436014.1 CPBP family intramembrane metalloprotease [Cyclobacterium sp. 1_MG-2023]